MEITLWLETQYRRRHGEHVLAETRKIDSMETALWLETQTIDSMENTLCLKPKS
jgi:hypothetical protein